MNIQTSGRKDPLQHICRRRKHHPSSSSSEQTSGSRSDDFSGPNNFSTFNTIPMSQAQNGQYSHNVQFNGYPQPYYGYPTYMQQGASRPYFFTSFPPNNGSNIERQHSGSSEEMSITASGSGSIDSSEKEEDSIDHKSQEDSGSEQIESEMTGIKSNTETTGSNNASDDGQSLNWPDDKKHLLDDSVFAEVLSLFASNRGVKTIGIMEISWSRVAARVGNNETEETCRAVFKKNYTDFFFKKVEDEQVELCRRIGRIPRSLASAEESEQISKLLGLSEKAPLPKKKVIEWTEEEKSMVEKMQKVLGNKWTLIAAKMNTGKTASQVKRYWFAQQEHQETPASATTIENVQNG